MPIRRRIEVSGIVQGVGFRPYIYRLASELHLTGTIRNTSSGVTIEIEGETSLVDEFLSRLPQEAPPLAQITDISATELPCNGDREFRIIASHAEEQVRTLISPDVATCDDCLRELFDPQDRRYRYPFTNCTNCGPRFTIIHDIPYDRPRTSMASFKMCAACQAEYEDPRNRRFHAQPNACWVCGPQLELWNNCGEKLECSDPVTETIRLLRDGTIVSIKGLGGFHLAADATNAHAVTLLRERKRRVGKPFAVMVPNLETAEEICEISDAEAAALTSIQRPIVLLRRRTGKDVGASTVADDVAPGNKYLGVFFPYTPLHHLILAEGGFSALVMTSGNLSEEPIAIANDEAFARLGTLADYFLVHNRDILLRCDDSVVRVLSTDAIPILSQKARHGWGNPASPQRPLRSKALYRRGHVEIANNAEKSSSPKTQPLRRSRGLVPVPVFLREEVPSILAVGGELKNTICLTKRKHAFLSQHVGDLENLESYKFFEEAIHHLQKVLEIQPQVIAYDLHPDYFSTRWALQKTGLPLVGVQHHHAHVASCMAENHVEGKVIGFALDGTGYGTDGKIWGGEVLIADYAGFERAAHFEYIPMPGGAAAIREPWRMAVSYLIHHFGEDLPTLKLPLLERVGRLKLDLIRRVLERRVNSPLTSSCGRLFDAVAAIAGVRDRVTYEAQAAIEFEMALAEDAGDEAYVFELRAHPKAVIIGTRPMFQALVEDVIRDRSVPEMSAKFHNGLVNVFLEVAERLRQRASLNRVCLSGGTFNNLYLTKRLSSSLTEAGFEVFTQNEVPAGDGGLSLGQAMVAAAPVPKD